MQLQDRIGHRYGKLTVISRAPNSTTTHGARWNCRCDCGTDVVVFGRNLTTGMSRSCGCSRGRGTASKFWRGTGEISRSYWSRTERGAKTRSISFEISIEDAWKLFLYQGRRCALTGLPLVFGALHRISGPLGTASLDRIDSQRGYTSNNVQWVHKDVNNMKQGLPEVEFVRLCSLVATKGITDGS